MNPFNEVWMAVQQNVSKHKIADVMYTSRDSLGVVAVELMEIESMISTKLMHFVLHLHNSTDLPHSDCRYVAIAQLLVIQGDFLPDVCIPSYIKVVKYFYLNTARNDMLAISKDVSSISSRLLNVSTLINEPKCIIRTLLIACKNTAPSANCLTANHAHFLQACISSQMYTFAVQQIHAFNILEIDPSASYLLSSDYLRYFYYAGICHIAVNDNAAAIDSLDMVMTLPAHAISEIVVSAYKKAKIVSLLVTGKAYHVPAYAAAIVNKFCKVRVDVYDDIIEFYEAGNIDGLTSYINMNNKCISTLQQDSSYGIAKRLITSLTKQKIKKLTDTYITLTLSDISTKVCDTTVGVEKYLYELIANHVIDAKISHSNSLVRFGNNDTTVVEHGEHFLSSLQHHMRDVFSLSDKLRDLNTKVLSSTDYLKKVSSSSSSHTYGSVEDMAPDAVWSDTEDM